MFHLDSETEHQKVIIMVLELLPQCVNTLLHEVENISDREERALTRLEHVIKSHKHKGGNKNGTKRH